MESNTSERRKIFENVPTWNGYTSFNDLDMTLAGGEGQKDISVLAQSLHCLYSQLESEGRLGGGRSAQHHPQQPFTLESLF